MQRMTGIDPMFVYSETPVTPMEVAYACVFDPDHGAGRLLLRSRQGRAGRTGADAAGPVPAPAHGRPVRARSPRWVDDPDFDLDNHLHRVALPAPGGEAELRAMVAAVMGRPLGPDQPPWEMHVVEGLEGGRVGLIAKIHHAVIDGVAGVQLMAQLLDLE